MKRIYLSGKKSQGYYALVDNEDYEALNKYKWKLQKGYACRNAYIDTARGVHIYKLKSMHRVIMDAPEGLTVDHINRNRLDNRKSNLRLCTMAQNLKNVPIRDTNKSGYKGVYLEKRTGKYYSQISNDSKAIHLGTFNTKWEAYSAYKKASKKYHREYSNV